MGNYLQPNRLQEVIRLIQVLGLGPHFNRQENALQGELNGPPNSVGGLGWVPLAAEHPEFFRAHQSVAEARNHSADLFSRLHQGGIGQGPIPIDRVKALIDIAIELHRSQAVEEERRQEAKANRRIIIAALITALISAVATIISALIAILAKK